MNKRNVKLIIRCHGHQCPDKAKCLLYSAIRVEDDGENGNNDIDCEMRRYYAAKVR